MKPHASVWTVARLALIAAGAAWLGWRALVDSALLLHFQPLGIDFMPMWAAGGQAFAAAGRVYDFAALTERLQPLLAGFHGLRPFVYAPPTLLLLWPLARLPFDAANLVWTGGSLALLISVMAHRLGLARTPLLLAVALSPASVLVLLTGQSTFLVAALVVAGLAVLGKRPLVAGALLGVAAVIKPPALILLPLALIGTREWRALAAAAATGFAAVAVSVVLFGVQPWLDWLAALPRFEGLIEAEPRLWRGMITPTGLGMTLGLGPAELATWRALFAVGGALIVWRVFRSTDELGRRAAALLGGALFVTPYAMHYDAALLAPAAALMLSARARRDAWLAALVAAGLLCCAAIPHWGAAAVIASVLLSTLMPETGVAPALGPFRSRSEAPSAAAAS